MNLTIDKSNFDSNDINDELKEKIILSSDKYLFPKTEPKIFSIIKTKKIPEIKRKNKMGIETKEKKEEINKKESSEKTKKSKTNNNNINSEIISPNERKEYRNKKLNKNNYNLIWHLNTIETESFRGSKINKLINNNHYKPLFTEIPNEHTAKTKKTKKKFIFSERKKNEKNKDLNKKITESSENYYDLYKKAFNDISDISLEQKFCFKPKMNKRYFNYDNTNNNNFYNDKNIKTYDDSALLNKKKLPFSFNPKREEKNRKEKLDLSLDVIKKNMNNKFFENEKENIKDEDEYDNNKNFILDLNHFIPIDKNKLLNTFSKPLFENKSIKIKKAK